MFAHVNITKVGNVAVATGAGAATGGIRVVLANGSPGDTAVDAFPVTPSNTVNFASQARGLYVGGLGDVVVLTPADTVVTFVGVLAGTILPVKAKRINLTGTTATSILGLV